MKGTLGCLASMFVFVAGTTLAVPATTATAAATRPASPAAYTTFSGRLYIVVAISARDVWAAGLTPNSSLIVHWNGKHWTIHNLRGAVPGGQFEGVAASLSANAWAVGSTGAQQTLIEHWNGKTWTRVPSPNVDTGNNLSSVTAISSDNAWASGTTSRPTVRTEP